MHLRRLFVLNIRSCYNELFIRRTQNISGVHYCIGFFQKTDEQIQEIDLVTPVKDTTSRFIANEIKVHQEDGSGDHLQNGSRNQCEKFRSPPMKVDRTSRIAPAGYESDLSDVSDDLELG